MNRNYVISLLYQNRILHAYVDTYNKLGFIGIFIKRLYFIFTQFDFIFKYNIRSQ